MKKHAKIDDVGGEDKENRSTRDQSSDSQDENGAPDEDHDNRRDGLSILSVNQFIDAISSEKNIQTMSALVDLSSLDAKSGREKADSFVNVIWERSQLKYRFTYHSNYKHVNTPTTRFVYNCVQATKRQHKSKKSTKEGVKNRDKAQMETFSCQGWIFVTIVDGESEAFVKFRHDVKHVPYWTIDIPSQVQEFIQKNIDLGPDKIWHRILEDDPAPDYSRRSVYQLWYEEASKDWKKDKDEVKSAKILLDEASKNPRSKLFQVETIPVHNEDGFTALAFCLPEFLRQWGGKVRELSLDSAWNTNGSNFEVYALLGEVSGSGCPLGYLLIQSAAGSEPGGKQRYLEEVLDHFKKNWKIKAI
ncbi:hypothetical protein CVT26_000899, partial [Gymnopilus dilepis]